MKTVKNQTARWKSLSGRLTAYSVMAGAALAFLPTAEGKMVSTSDYSSTGSASICEMLPQSQHIQTQKLRHNRQAKMRVMGDTTSCTPTNNNTTGGE